MTSSARTPELPADVLARVAATTGGIERIEPLGGLSGRAVAAVHGAGGTLVVKGPAASAEVDVARRLSPMLARHGVRTPRIEAVLDAAGHGTWLVMEHLPRALPRERWGADDAVIDALRSLHAIPPSAVEGIPDRYRPAWDDGLTSAAAEVLGADGDVAHRLAELARRAQDLFVPRCVISGDPNPLNWRLDDQGRPVLLDLERLTLAAPAVDLAIVLPGLPDRAAVAAVTARYGTGAPAAADVLLAKAWTVVELAAASAPGAPAHDVATRVAPRFLAWLDDL